MAIMVTCDKGVVAFGFQEVTGIRLQQVLAGEQSATKAMADVIFYFQELALNRSAGRLGRECFKFSERGKEPISCEDIPVFAEGGKYAVLFDRNQRLSMLKNRFAEPGNHYTKESYYMTENKGLGF